MIAFLAAIAASVSQPNPAHPLPPCTAGEAVRTSVAEIGAHPERFLDRCVTVTGAYAGITMFSGRDGLYLVNRYGRDGNHLAAHLVHRIGIDNQDLRDLRLSAPHRTTVTGRVDMCERRSARSQAAAEGARRGSQEIVISFLTGYCHYYSGPTILVSAYDLTEARYERMTGEAARRAFGNLVPMPADWPARAEVETVTAEFLQALRAGDRGALAALHETNAETNEHGRALLFMLRDDQQSVFAGLRRAAPMQTAIFVSAAADGPPLGRNDGPAATICFCRTADCAGRWPIAINDADNDLDRPYACIRAEPRDYPPRRVVLNTPVSRGGLTEPAASAFRAASNGSTR